MVTIADIAKKAGVAQSTVSNVLTNKKFVSAQLKKKVMKICKEMNFQPNFYAATLMNGKTNIIALFLEQNEAQTYQSFYNELIKSCVMVSAQKKYNLLVYYGVENDRLITLLQQGKAPIDGAIILSPCLHDERINQIQTNRIPCAVIGRPDCSLKNMGSIDVNNYQLCFDVGTKLLQAGYRNICLLNSRKDMTISIDRENGFNEALCQFGGGAMTVFHSQSSISSEGYSFANKALSYEPDVFITANEDVAEGVYKALNEKGIVIGKQISVFALGCEKAKAESFTPTLSFAYQNYSEIGKLAVDMLLEEISGGEKVGDAESQCEIFFKDSCPLERK